MRIYARSPLLACISGVSGIIVQTSVVVQEIMAQVELRLVVFYDGLGVGSRQSVGYPTPQAPSHNPCLMENCHRFPFYFRRAISWDVG